MGCCTCPYVALRTDSVTHCVKILLLTAVAPLCNPSPQALTSCGNPGDVLRLLDEFRQRHQQVILLPLPPPPSLLLSTSV